MIAAKPHLGRALVLTPLIAGQVPNERNPAEPADPGRRTTLCVRQARSNECGLACLLMVAGHHDLDCDLSSLRKLCMLSPEGVTLKSLIGAATRIGLDTRALKSDPRDLQLVTLPAVLHWNAAHFVVLAAVGRGSSGDLHFNIHDPSRGSLSLGEAELSFHFTGAILELTKVESACAARPLQTAPGRGNRPPFETRRMPWRAHPPFHSPAPGEQK